MQSKIDLLNTEISGWQIVAHLFEHDENQHWALMRREKESGEWVNYRLCACGGKLRKRSYWLAYSPTGQRMSENKDAHHLAWGKPELIRMVMRYLGKTRTPSKEGRASNTKRALERLRTSNPFDRAN